MNKAAKCSLCHNQGSAVRRSISREALCKDCFCDKIEKEVFERILQTDMIRKGEKVVIGASGGKDSTVLIHILKQFNDKETMNLDLHLLSIDEGIRGYRDASLATVQTNANDYQLPLHVYTYEELYGTTMDEVVDRIGMKNNCTVCGVFRRRALETGASQIGADVIATGHNADDQAETNLLNIVRGDTGRLTRTTKEHRRCKPLERIYEREIVLYAHFKRLKYFSTECTYFPQSHRGYFRDLIKKLEAYRPASIQCINDTLAIELGALELDGSRKKPLLGKCVRCGEAASMNICKACNVVEGLHTNIPMLGIGKTEKIRRANKLEPLVFYRTD